jgi:RNA polymerase sigma-70 factor (ECF subfamily)
MPDVTDEEIAKKVQAGDGESFGLLMQRYEAKLTRYARRFLFNGDDSHDVVQEVFIKAYVNIKSFNTSKRFSPWIYRIAHNEFVNAIKKKQRSREMLFSFFEPDVFFPHPFAKETATADVERAEVRAELEKGLNKIGPKYREPLVLYYFEEMDYREIAEVLRIPAATVGVRLKRGRDALKKVMQTSS